TAMVAMKPHSISWACQATAKNGAGMSAGVKIQIAMEIRAQAQPQIYRGRKPRLRNTERSGGWAATFAGLRSVMVELPRHAIGFTVHLIPEPQAAGDALSQFLGLVRHIAVAKFRRRLVKKIEPA